MEDKYKKFLQVDWENNQEWQLYFSNLLPTPPGSKVLYFKKKFYKLKIDNDFDITYDPELKTKTSKNKPYSSSNQYQANSFVSYYSHTTKGKIISFIEVALWIISVLLLMQYHSKSLMFSIFVLLFRIFKRVGLPKLNMEFAQSLFLDEHLHILLVNLLLMIDRLNQYTLFPFYLTALLNIFDCFRNYNILTGLSSYIINKRVILCELRANSDLMIGILLFFGIFFHTNSFLLPIFYCQFLRFKYIFNSDTNLAFRRLNILVDQIKPKLPSFAVKIISKIQELASYLGRTEAKDGQKAGGANCIVF